MLKSILIVAGAVITLTSAVSGWLALGWWTPASRDYVRVEVARVAGPVLGLAEASLGRLRLIRDGHVARLAMTTDSQARDDLRLLIAQDDRDIAEVESWIKELEKIK